MCANESSTPEKYGVAMRNEMSGVASAISYTLPVPGKRLAEATLSSTPSILSRADSDVNESRQTG